MNRNSSIAKYGYYSFSLSLIVTCVLSIFLFWNIWQKISKQIEAEMDQQIRVIGEVSTYPIENAINLDIPLDKIKGLEEYFSEISKKNPFVCYLAFADGKGNLYTSFQKKNCVRSEGSEERIRMTPKNTSTEAYLIVGADKAFTKNSFLDIFYDALIVLFIALLITFELLTFLINYKILHPLTLIRTSLEAIKKKDFTKGLYIKSLGSIGDFGEIYNRFLTSVSEKFYKAQNKFTASKNSKITEELEQYKVKKPEEITLRKLESVSYIKVPLFIFIFAESLSISFLPIYSEILYEPIFGLSINILSSLPISIFMFIFTISMPVYSNFLNRYLSNTLFIFGSIITSAGLLSSALVSKLGPFIFSRIITALGYGMVLIATQTYIAHHTSSSERTRGMSLYISGFFSATLGGSAIGAILAQTLGFRGTFVLSSIVCFASTVFVYFYIQDKKNVEKPIEKTAGFSTYLAILSNKAFLKLVLLVSLPSKMILTCSIYYITPVYLQSAGMSQSSIGRIIMIYGVFMTCLTPLTARYSDKTHNPLLFICVGSLLSGLSVFPLFYAPNFIGLAFSTAIMGLGHGLSNVSQTSIVFTLLNNECKRYGDQTVISTYRLLEFQGYVLGPIAGGFLLGKYGFPNAYIIAGGIIFFLALLYVLQNLYLSHKKGNSHA
jgi:predicted MFS family arabinose efflux permease